MKNFLLILLVFLCCAGEARAQNPERLDYGAFSQLPILHEGRVKPLDSFARLKLRSISGEDTFKGKPAILWLAETLFDPVMAAQTPVIAITPGWRDTLGLKAGRKFYSLDEVLAALQDYGKIGEDLKNMDPEKLTPHQRELRDIYDAVIGYNELLRSFSAALPLTLDVPEKYKTGKDENTYLDFLPRQNQMQDDIAILVDKKGTDIKKYNDTEKQLISFVYALEEVRAGGAGNNALKIIHAGNQWFSPWELLLQKNISIETWADMAAAYRAGDAKAWLAATKAARDNSVSQSRLWLERFYNITNPFRLAIGFYILGMILFAAEIYRKSNRLIFPLLCLGLGLFSHAAGIIARIYILGRAPVGTLYESLLFVSLICAVTGLMLFLRRRNYSVYFSATGSAVFLLFIAPFLIQQGESMQTLVAVLNTNFWLGTHVLCITAGYGVSILVAVLAHAWLFLRWKDISIRALMPLYSRIYKISLVALLLTAVGTILGGIWADQSWGRFWGWDPKENGALLIVLWVIWIQHGRISGHFQPTAFIAATAYLNVIVALAWFGVNLLSVGLHSYGFINGIAWALGLFCLAETILIGILWRLNAGKANTITAI
jgi:ABC-type transport system involved in cytochrome c biogenesis permease subunit